MQRFALVLFCWARASYAQPSRSPIGHKPSIPPSEGQEMFALTALLNSLNAVVAFNPPTLQVSTLAKSPSAIASRPAGSQRSLIAMYSAAPSVESPGPAIEDDRFNIAKYRDLHRISLRGEGDELYEPFYTFASAPFAPAIKEVFKKDGYDMPTPIQAQAWPIALQGRDIISVAWHGTGKTGAYLAPIYHKLMVEREAKKKLLSRDEGLKVGEGFTQIQRKYLFRLFGDNGANIKAIYNATGCVLAHDNDDESNPICQIRVRGPAAKVEVAQQLIQNVIGDHRPKVLVLAPTGQSVDQIAEQALRYTQATHIWSLGAHAGTPKSVQLSEMKSTKPEVLITTPLRCKEFIDIGGLDLSQVEYVVFDEVDETLDMGFEPLVSDIISQLPQDRQSFMFSARWPQEVRNFANKVVDKPIEVNVEEGVDSANRKAKQTVRLTHENDKTLELWKALQEINFGQEDPVIMTQSMIFVDSNERAEAVAYDLHEHGLSVRSFHGCHEQDDEVMEAFRKGDIRTLVTTDLSARGLESQGVAAVINYDMPPLGHAHDYLRRLGHISHGTQATSVYSLLTPQDLLTVPHVAQALIDAGHRVPDQLIKISASMGIEFDRNTKDSQYLYDDEQDLETPEDQVDRISEHQSRRNRAYGKSTDVDSQFDRPDSSDQQSRRNRAYSTSTDLDASVDEFDTSDHQSRRKRAYSTSIDVDSTVADPDNAKSDQERIDSNMGAYRTSISEEDEEEGEESLSQLGRMGQGQPVASPEKLARARKKADAWRDARTGTEAQKAIASLDEQIESMAALLPHLVETKNMAAEEEHYDLAVKVKEKIQELEEKIAALEELQTQAKLHSGELLGKISTSTDEGFKLTHLDISDLHDKEALRYTSRSNVLNDIGLEDHRLKRSAPRRAFQSLLGKLLDAESESEVQS